MKAATAKAEKRGRDCALGYCCRQLLKCCDKFCCGPEPHFVCKVPTVFDDATRRKLSLKVILKTARRMDYFLLARAKDRIKHLGIW